jgi:hypothetical protein
MTAITWSYRLKVDGSRMIQKLYMTNHLGCAFDNTYRRQKQKNNTEIFGLTAIFIHGPH